MMYQPPVVVLATTMVLLLAGLSAAANSPVTVNPKLDRVFRVDEGFAKVFEFKLDEPIICPDNIDRECNVVIKLTNSHPDEIALDTCHVKWLKHQWTESRFVTIRAVEDFVDDAEKDFTIVTEPIDSASLYYNGLDLDDLQLETAPRPSAVCRATGDPHYRSFDGHPFHIYAPGRVVFYKSTVREFEMQTDMYSFARPAVHCAVAVKENNDIVVISLCEDGHTVNYRRTCGSKECLKGGFPRVGVTGSSHPRYVIDFASGARITAQVAYWSTIRRRYINVYATAPGKDRGLTEGVCGNNDGDSTNDVNVGYNRWMYSLNDLYESQRPKRNLFNWYPSEIVESTNPLPPFAEECDYKDPEFIRPILNNPDVEDITMLLRDSIPAEREDAEGIEFDGTAVAENLPAELTEDEARVQCDKLHDHPATIRCLELFPEFPINEFHAQCIDDLIETGGDPDFLDIAIEALEDQCADFGNRDLDTWEKDENENPVEPDTQLQQTLCPNACSGNGQCVKAKCVCNDNFSGEDCSINRLAPPVVESAEDALCDSRGRFGCPTHISVNGNNFWASPDLVCRFDGQHVTEAFYLSALEVRCQVPSIEHSGATEIVHTIEVSTDGGQTWSDVASGADDEAVTFTWYDSICQICDNSSPCTPNPDSCTVDSVCYLQGQHDPDNVCKTCKPDTTSSAFSFDYENGAECGPSFENTMYQARIVGSGKQGDVLATVSARNPLVSADPANTITYAIRGDNHILAIDASGQVTLAQDFTVTEQSLHSMDFQSLVHVVATDAANNEAEVPLYIELQLTNSKPVFPQEEYVFTVDETASVGHVVGSAVAQDANTEGDWGELVYAWAHVEANHADTFAVNPSTGAIRVGQALDFESKSEYTMRLSARDGGGQSHITKITIRVNDVNEAPTNIELSGSSVPENQPEDTVVATIAVTDQDAEDTHTVAVTGEDAASFVISSDGTQLLTARAFDFEDDADKLLTITLVATDAAGKSFSKTFEIEVTNVNEAPFNVRLVNEPEGTTSITVPEAIAVDRIVADVAVDDVDSDVVGCTLTQTDGNNFIMQNRRIVVVNPLDFETDNEHVVEVVCADDQGEESEPLRITVHVADNNDGPEDVALALETSPVPENTPASTLLGSITARDHDVGSGALAFALDEEAASVLALSEPGCDATATGGMECVVHVTLVGTLDYEQADESGAFAFVVRVTDSTGLANEVELRIPLANANDPATGVVWLNNGGSIVESAQPGDVVGDIAVVDEDVAQLYTIQLTSHTDMFEVRDSTQQETRRRRALEDEQAPASSSAVNTNFGATVVVRDISSLSAGDSVSVGVSVTDNSDEPVTSSFTIDVTVEREPLSIAFEDGTHFAGVEENVAEGTLVGTFVVRGAPSGGVPTITLKPRSASPTPFRIEGSRLLVDGEVDYELHQAFLVDVSVAFPNLPGNTESIDNERFTVYVTDVNEPITFVNMPATPVRVNTDSSAQSTVFRFTAQDPERRTVRYSLVHDETNLFTLTADGSLRLKVMPSAHTVNHGVFGVEVQATLLNNADNEAPVSATLEVQLHDDCFGQTCSGQGRCVDAFRTFTCECNRGFFGDECDQTTTTSATETTGTDEDTSTTAAPVTDENGNVIDPSVNFEESSSSTAGLAAPALAGIVVGVVALMLLVVLVVVIVMRRRHQEEQFVSAKSIYGGHDNPMFVSPQYASATPTAQSEPTYEYSMAFQPGMTNPLYAWYQPDYTRQETTNELLSAPIGSFIVRDSKATPGWHMLGVRTDEAVIHEKVRRTDDGFYELVPSNNRAQPAFPDLPSLVGYYGSAETDAGFRLSVSSLDNPMYNASAHAGEGATYQAVSPGMWTRDEAAPAVPLKEREKEAVQQFAVGDGNDLYLNTAEAKAALADA